MPNPASPSPSAPCPCGSGKTFGECCGPILARERLAATAEELMRSRYTAHAIYDFEHLHRTYLPTASQPYVPSDEGSDMVWTRLVIHRHEPGPRPDQATVDFTAWHRDDQGGEQPLAEKSEFLRKDGQWYYTRALRQGPAPVKAAQAKVGRNDPCPCGSGKKYKHCHGR